MELNRLQEFILIATHHSITKAAAELSLSPATLSARLRTFEASLGTPLFSREASELQLTPAGQQFYNHALEISSDYENLKQDLKDLSDGELKHLRIAVSGTSLPLHLGPFLDMINLQSPHSSLEILDDTRHTITEGLLSEHVDLYFATAMNRFRPEGLIRNSFVSSQQYVVMPASHPLSSRLTLSLADLNGEEFILYPKSNGDSSLRDFQLENLKASGIRYSIYENNSSPIFYQLLVPIGKGIFLSPSYVQNLPPNSVCIPLDNVPYPASSALFYSREKCRPEAKKFAREFLNFAKEMSTNDHGKTI